jgi:hypothetical protein
MPPSAGMDKMGALTGQASRAPKHQRRERPEESAPPFQGGREMDQLDKTDPFPTRKYRAKGGKRKEMDPQRPRLHFPRSSEYRLHSSQGVRGESRPGELRR